MVSRAALLLLLFAVGARAGENEAPFPGMESMGPGDVPAIDVEANVRKMLEESRSRQPGPAPSLPVSPAVAPPAIIAPPKGPGPTISPGPEPEDYVPLPEGTITVRSLGDVERVDRQLKDARKRSGPAPAGKVPPAQQQ
jgi:hypothetical protein